MITTTTVPKVTRYRVREIAGIFFRESSVPVTDKLCDDPEKALAFYREAVLPSFRFTPGVENLVVLFLSARRTVKGFQIVTTGTIDTLLAHPREIFRAAIINNAGAIIIMHNHPSGDPTPSEADVKVTRDMIRAGQLLKIDVLDHVIVGQATTERSKDYSSLRELGYFYS